MKFLNSSTFFDLFVPVGSFEKDNPHTIHVVTSGKYTNISMVPSWGNNTRCNQRTEDNMVQTANDATHQA